MVARATEARHKKVSSAAGPGSPPSHESDSDRGGRTGRPAETGRRHPTQTIRESRLGPARARLAQTARAHLAHRPAEGLQERGQLHGAREPGRGGAAWRRHAAHPRLLRGEAGRAGAE